MAQEVTLIRMGMNGNRFYYLYQEKGGQAFVSQLPVWMTEDHFYRRVSNALLSAKQSLPAATYHEDGAIVMLSLQYLLAAEELNLITLEMSILAMILLRICWFWKSNLMSIKWIFIEQIIHG